MLEVRPWFRLGQAIASSVQLLGENPGWHLEDYGANWRDCWARVTWSQLGKDFLINGASFGLGYAAGPALDALGEWLSGAEEGVRATPYGELRGNLPESYQANHLNQNAAYRDVIPSNKGLANAMEGNAFTDPGTPHYDFHESLENFWDQYREGGALEGSTPTNADYTNALENALKAGGLSAEEAESLAAQAAQQQAEYGLSPSDLVPRVPGSINQVPRP